MVMYIYIYDNIYAICILFDIYNIIQHHIEVSIFQKTDPFTHLLTILRHQPLAEQDHWSHRTPEDFLGMETKPCK